MQTQLRRNDTITVKLPSLATPIVIENFLRMLMGSVNVIMLGHYSDNAVGAVGVANQLNSMVLMLYSITSAGTAIVISQYLGAMDKIMVSRVANVAISLNAMLGIVMSAVMLLFSNSILRIMDLPDELMKDAGVYLRIVGGASFLQAITAAMSAVARSYGKARLPMITSIIMNVINIIGNYIVIFKPFPIGLSGVAGVAISLVFSSFIAFIIISCLLMGSIKLKLNLKVLIPLPKREIKEILSVGVPAGIETMSYNLTQIVSTYIITRLGSEVLAAKIYVQNIIIFVNIFGFSLGQATQIMIGHLVGAGKQNEAFRAANNSLKIVLVTNIVLSILVLIFRKPFIGLYTQNLTIIELIAPILLFDILVETGRAFNHIYSHSLRGAGDVRYPMMIAIISMWGISVVMSYILGISLGLGLLGIWIAFALDEWFRGLLLLRRWRSRIWQQMFIVKS